MFCSRCGAPVTGAFCTQCGAQASQPSPSAPPPQPVQSVQPAQYVQPPASAAKSGGGWKILIAVLAILGLLGVLAIAGLWYAVHRVKQEVKQAAASQGIDLSAITETHRGPARTFDACELLTKEDLSQILSLPVERVVSSGKSATSSCEYYSSQALQRSQEEAAAVAKKIAAEKPSDNPAEKAQGAREAGDLFSSIAGVAGAMNNGPILTISIDSESPGAVVGGFKMGTGFGMADLLSKKMGGAPNLVTENVPGVGDEGVYAPMLGWSVFRKGDVAVIVGARALPGGRDVQIAIAKRVFSKL